MHVHVCVTLHGYLHVNVNVNASSRSLTHPVFFHSCLPGTLFRSPLMSASPSSMTARVQSSLNQLPAGRPSYSSFLPFLWCVQGVSVWQTIPEQLPWQTEAGALVPAGHTKLFSSQLVCLSLWLNAWCHWIQRISIHRIFALSEDLFICMKWQNQKQPDITLLHRSSQPLSFSFKLDGVGPVDNRRSNN